MKWIFALVSLFLLFEKSECTQRPVGYAFQLSPSFVFDVSKCAEYSYERLNKLEEDESITLFFCNSSRVNDNNPEEQLCGFVKKLDESLVIAFHGTRTEPKNLSDFDFKIDADIFGDGSFAYKTYVAPNIDKFETHSGFSGMVMSCYDNVCRIIDENEFDQLIFTGHSMGAAIAQLFALMYCKRNGITAPQTKVKVFAFNSPPVFNREATKEYHKTIQHLNSIHMYVNFDIVTYLFKPGSTMCHVGIQACLNSKSRPIVKPSLVILFGLVSSFLSSKTSNNSETISNALDVVCSLHGMNYDRDDIESVLAIINENYYMNPCMDRESLGRK